MGAPSHDKKRGLLKDVGRVVPVDCLRGRSIVSYLFEGSAPYFQWRVGLKVTVKPWRFKCL